MKKFLGKYAIWLTILLAAVGYGLLTVIRHNHFQSFGYDLGLYDQALWLYSRFQIPYSTIKVPPLLILGDHFAPSFALLAPIFWFFNDVRALILAQVILICISAYPVFALAKQILKNTLVSWAIAVSYLSFYAVQNALSFDVHMITFGAALFPWLFYFLETKKFQLYWLFFLIALGFKEDITIILFTIGIYGYLRYRFTKLAIASMVVSGLWFLLVTRVFIPAASGSFLYGSEIPQTLTEIMGMFLPVGKWVTVFWSLLPFGFLPLLGWSTLPMVAGHLVVHWLDPRYFGRWEMALHYQVPLASMLAVGAVWGLAKLPKKIFVPAGFLILGLALFSDWKLHLPINAILKPNFYRQESWYQAANKLISLIPLDASVSTQNNFISHLSHRRKVYLLWGEGRQFSLDRSPCGEISCPWLRVDDANYILVSRLPNQPANNFWGYPQERAYQAIDNLVTAGYYKLVTDEQGIYLYQKLPR